MKTLAIITPVYNTENYLEAFIESIISQKNIDFDIYLVDDGSSDRSFAILEHHAKNDKRFYVFRKKNGGVSSARNFALEAIKKANKEYEYIYFCDSDDWVDEGALYKVVSEMKIHNADYGIFSVRKAYKSKTITSKKHIQNIEQLNHEDILNQYFRNTYKWRKEPCSEAFLNNKIFRAKLVINKRFDETLKRSEDFVFFMCLSKELHKGVLVPDAWFNYRMRRTSLTHCGFKSGDFDACLNLLKSSRPRSNLEIKLLQHKFWRAAYLEIFSGANINEVNQKVREQGVTFPFLIRDIKSYLFLFLTPVFFIKLYGKFRNIVKSKQESTDLFD